MYSEVKLMGPPLSLVITFVLKSILADTSITTPDFYVHIHKLSFSIPLLSLCVCLLIWSESLLDNICKDLLFSPIQPHYVLIGVFNPFTFTIIVDSYIVIAILLLIFLSFFLLLKEVPLTFLVILVWWSWTPLAFSCLGSSLFVLRF